MVRNSLLAFDLEQSRRGAYARRDAGLQTIDVARVVGSVGRARELDRRFRHRSLFRPRGSESRLTRLIRLFDSGGVPPLELYQIDEDLFVLDGHHRVSLALARGQEFLEAHVVEYLPDPRDPANQVYYERRAFVAEAGVRGVHVSEPGRYPKLLNRVRDYTRARPGATARLWFDTEYRAVIEQLRARRVPSAFPGRMLGDLYGYVLDHCWYASERSGWDVGLAAALDDFIDRHAPPSIVESLLVAFVRRQQQLGAVGA